MNEIRKTLTFVGIAGAAIILAWEPWQNLHGVSIDNGPAPVTRLFPKFDDATAAKSIRITKFNESNGRLQTFSVKQVNGRWLIPSHHDYPADAREHMAAAAVTVSDIESVNIASDRPGDFETFGVVAPDASKLKAGATGVGMEVVFSGADDKTLADLIVGKKDKDNPELRFARVADHDQIYKVKLNIDKLSTKFDDWIEKDLLKLNPLDVRELSLNDYSIKQVADADGQRTLAMEQRSNVKLSYDDAKSKWQLDALKEFKQGEPIDAKLGPDEEPDAEKLNALKNALGDLKIIDVQRKPAGLEQDLSVGDALARDREAMRSLVERGFYPYRLETGETELASSEGEAVVYCKDGIEYTLRFGATAVADAEEEEADDAGKDGAGKDESAKAKKSRLSRYLMVTCKFLQDRIPLPELKEAPPAPEGEQKSAEGQPAEPPPADEKPADEKPAGEKAEAAAPKENAAPAEAPPEGEKTPPAKTDQSANPRPNVFRLTADEKPAEPAEKSAEPTKQPAEPTKQPAEPTEKPVEPTEKPVEAKETAPVAKEAPAAPAASPAPAAESDEKTKTDAPADDEEGGKIRRQAREAKALADQRTLIEKENKRNQADYDEKIKSGTKRAKELNERFAPWYYLISDEVYRKIHLSRAEIIKTKAKDAAHGDGPGALDMLKNQGVGGAAHDHDHEKK